MLERRLLERADVYGQAAAVPGFRARWRRAEIALKWAAVLLGCSIPVSAAFDNVLFGGILFFWLAGGGYREKLAAIRGNPVAWMALALFALFVVGSLYSTGTAKDVVDALIRSLRLLLIPALVYLMRDPEWRERGIAAFLASMLVALVMSYLIWLGVMSSVSWLKGTRLDPAVFKTHITHNVFMAFAAFLLAQGAREAKTLRGRIVRAALCAAAVANVLLMVPGRTGIVVLLVLFVYSLGRVLKGRGIVLAGLALAALVAIVLATPDSMLHRRFTLADEEFAQWRAGIPPEPTSSVGLRLEFLANTLEIIGENPLLGVGTGGFGKAYAERVDGTGASATQNPHNEILLMIVQFGIAGFVLLVGLFVTQWRLAPRLPNRFEQAAARALVLTFAVTSLLSSSLLDHAEGFFFVYMSGLLFAGYRAGLPDALGQRQR
jgi:O-antigen ligase